MDVTALRAFLSVTGKALLSENLIIVMIAMWSVRGHFKKLEKALTEVAKKVGELSDALLHLELRHSERITMIEKRVERLEVSKPQGD